jgi:hypothetical protein
MGCSGADAPSGDGVVVTGRVSSTDIGEIRSPASSIVFKGGPRLCGWSS